MFKSWFGASLAASVAMTLFTAASGSAQVYNTIAVDTPRGIIFYTLPASSPYVASVSPSLYGAGFAPISYGALNYSAPTYTVLAPAAVNPVAATAVPGTGIVPAAFETATSAAPGAAATPAVPAGTAAIDVRVPAGAKVSVNGQKVEDKGGTRRFVSPPLNGTAQTYEVKVTWAENGREVTRQERLTVQAGDRQSVTFPEAFAAKAEKKPTASEE